MTGTAWSAGFSRHAARRAAGCAALTGGRHVPLGTPTSEAEFARSPRSHRFVPELGGGGIRPFRSLSAEAYVSSGACPRQHASIPGPPGGACVNSAACRRRHASIPQPTDGGMRQFRSLPAGACVNSEACRRRHASIPESPGGGIRQFRNLPAETCVNSGACRRGHASIPGPPGRGIRQFRSLPTEACVSSRASRRGMRQFQSLPPRHALVPEPLAEAYVSSGTCRVRKRAHHEIRPVPSASDSGAARAPDGGCSPTPYSRPRRDPARLHHGVARLRTVGAGLPCGKGSDPAPGTGRDLVEDGRPPGHNARLQRSRRERPAKGTARGWTTPTQRWPSAEFQPPFPRAAGACSDTSSIRPGTPGSQTVPTRQTLSQLAQRPLC